MRIGWSADRARQKSSATPAAPRTTLASHGASHGGRRPAERRGARRVQQHVVREDDADAQREARELAVLAVADAERQANQRQHEARRRQRELLLDRVELAVVDRPVRGVLGRGLAQLGDGYLVVAFDDLRPREHGVGVHVEHLVLEGGPVVRFGLAGIRRVHGAVLEHQLDLAPGAIDRQPALPREVHRRLIRLRRVGQEHVAPAAARRDVAHVEDAVREVREEDARLDVALRAGRHHVEGELAEGLVRVRQRHDRLVGGRRGRQDGEQRNRAHQAEDADAAGLQRHELAVRRQASEAEQHAEQQRHRDRDAQRLGRQRQQRAKDDGPADALGDQLLGALKNRRHHQHEREADQRQRAAAAGSRARGTDRES